jgi:hypothetical protein
MIKKKEKFDEGINDFENEGIKKIKLMKDKLVKERNEKKNEIIKRNDDVIERWKKLIDD